MQGRLVQSVCPGCTGQTEPSHQVTFTEREAQCHINITQIRGDQIRAHRAIIAARCPYLMARWVRDVPAFSQHCHGVGSQPTLRPVALESSAKAAVALNAYACRCGRAAEAT